MDHVKVGRANQTGGGGGVHHHYHHHEDQDQDQDDLRRGPWTFEEDFTLINYIALHGEGRWNSLARRAGLKRTGKSCRLRWLNYLRPDVRRGNITLEEQLLILELHSRWGNRWSKIAQHLPGRTDNEIKNYWRTRVQKHAKQLKCDVNSKQFKDTMRYLWMPRLIERIQAAAAVGSSTTTTTNASATTSAASSNHQFYPQNNNNNNNNNNNMVMMPQINNNNNNMVGTNYSLITPENSTSDSVAQVSPVSELTTDCYNYPAINNQINNNNDYYQAASDQIPYGESLTSPNMATYYNQGLDFQDQVLQNNWMDGGDVSDNLWTIDEMWFLQQQLNNNV